MMKLEIKNCLMNINGVLWLVIEANSMDAIERAVVHAQATGSIGASWSDITRTTGIYATVERAKQP